MEPAEGLSVSGLLMRVPRVVRRRLPCPRLSPQQRPCPQASREAPRLHVICAPYRPELSQMWPRKRNTITEIALILVKGIPRSRRNCQFEIGIHIRVITRPGGTTASVRISRPRHA